MQANVAIQKERKRVPTKLEAWSADKVNDQSFCFELLRLFEEGAISLVNIIKSTRRKGIFKYSDVTRRAVSITFLSVSHSGFLLEDQCSLTFQSLAQKAMVWYLKLNPLKNTLKSMWGKLGIYLMRFLFTFRLAVSKIVRAASGWANMRFTRVWASLICDKRIQTNKFGIDRLLYQCTDK